MRLGELFRQRFQDVALWAMQHGVDAGRAQGGGGEDMRLGELSSDSVRCKMLHCGRGSTVLMRDGHRSGGVRTWGWVSSLLTAFSSCCIVGVAARCGRGARTREMK